MVKVILPSRELKYSGQRRTLGKKVVDIEKGELILLVNTIREALALGFFEEVDTNHLYVNPHFYMMRPITIGEVNFPTIYCSTNSYRVLSSIEDIKKGSEEIAEYLRSLSPTYNRSYVSLIKK